MKMRPHLEERAAEVPPHGRSAAISWVSMAARTPPPAQPGPRRSQSSAPNFGARRASALLVVGVVLVVGYSLIRALGSYLGGDDGVAESSPSDVSSVTSPVEDDADAGDTSAADSEREDVAADADTADIDCSDDESSELCNELGLSDDATVADDDDDIAGDGDVESETESNDTESTGPPTSNNPAKVYIVGDSDAGTFGPYLQTLLDGTLVTTTDLNYKVSSGLARPDFFNWPAELDAKMPEVDPDIVVVTFGGNDSQGLSLPELTAEGNIDFIIGDPVSNEADWLEEYEKRAGEIMDLLLENDRHVIWVGIPNDDNPEVTAALALQDQAAKAAAADRPDVVFVDTWSRFSGRDGGWAEFVVDPRDQEGKDVRADDGFHLNQNGAEILAIDIAIEVQKELRAMGADL